VGYDAGLLQRCLDGLEQIGMTGIRSRNVFGMRGLMWLDRMFAAVGEDSIIVKLRRTELERALAHSGVRPFQPDGSTTLGTWIEIDQEVVADDPDLRTWLEAGLRGVR
jgi:TfoX/Sxy family transcriptional regulator of competence genes